MEEIVAGESEDKLLVPLPRLCKGLLPVSPAMPAFNTVEAGKSGGNWGQTFSMFFVMESPMRREDFPVRPCEISAISFAFADLLRGSKGLKGAPSVPFDL